MKPLDDLRIPDSIKVTMVFIDRVGFPILAFLLMFVYSVVSLHKVTETLDRISFAVVNKAEVSHTEHERIFEEIRDFRR